MPAFDNLPTDYLDKLQSLRRYDGCDSHLRAFDTADIYLISEAAAALESARSVWVIADNFGALTLAVLLQGLDTGLNFDEASARIKLVYTDSFVAARAIGRNIRGAAKPEQVYTPPVEHDACNFPAYTQPDLILGRVPKAKSQLAFLLEQLKASSSASSRLFLSGMDKHLAKGHYDLIGRNYGPAGYSLARAKARVWHASVDLSLPSSKQSSKNYQFDSSALLFSSRPNSFSAGKLDPGAAFFLDHLDKVPSKSRVGDLGCGNGILGLSYINLNPVETLLLSDDSYQAIEASQNSLALNQSTFDATCTSIRTTHTDAMYDEPEGSLDLILCNPPFHTQNAVSRAVASRLFDQAQRLLTQDGQLWVVANRHLHYRRYLAASFSHCEQISANPQFVLLRAVK